MNRLLYFIHKNRIKTAIAVALSLTLIFTVILVINKKAEKVRAGANFISDVSDEDIANNKVKDSVTVLRRITVIDTDGSTVYEIGFNKETGLLDVYKNGQDTGEASRIQNYELHAGVLERIENATPIELNELVKTQINNVYKANIEQLSGVVKYKRDNGESLIREVNAQDFIDIYLMNTDGTIERIVGNGTEIVVAVYESAELPNIENYLNTLN